MQKLKPSVAPVTTLDTKHSDTAEEFQAFNCQTCIHLYIDTDSGELACGNKNAEAMGRKCHELGIDKPLQVRPRGEPIEIAADENYCLSINKVGDMVHLSNSLGMPDSRKSQPVIFWKGAIEEVIEALQSLR